MARTLSISTTYLPVGSLPSKSSPYVCCPHQKYKWRSIQTDPLPRKMERRHRRESTIYLSVHPAIDVLPLPPNTSAADSEAITEPRPAQQKTENGQKEIHCSPIRPFDCAPPAIEVLPPPLVPDAGVPGLRLHPVGELRPLISGLLDLVGGVVVLIPRGEQ
jgi:hypothetical protein